jgi:hypothetical protein
VLESNTSGPVSDSRTAHDLAGEYCFGGQFWQEVGGADVCEVASRTGTKKITSTDPDIARDGRT